MQENETLAQKKKADQAFFPIPSAKPPAANNFLQPTVYFYHIFTFTTIWQAVNLLLFCYNPGIFVCFFPP
jgi:hypothetical protein